MRGILPIIWVLEEARHQGIPILNAKSEEHCKVFKDNAGLIDCKCTQDEAKDKAPQYQVPSL
jgi:hypothetical protein